ncbi:MAG: ACP S-malonyltransferase [Actinomycetota bacterium]
MTHAILFPGQGSQYVGMGADLFDARPDLLGPAIDEVLGWSLRSMCLDGPEEALTRTEHAQPALYAISFALWEALAGAAPSPPAAAAGHSLGEYTALAAAGVFSFIDGLRLVVARGRAMSAAADVEPSGMAALIGGEVADAEALAATRRDEGGRLWVANVNAPGQVVVAGGAGDLEWAASHAAAFGIRRVLPLKVAGAFHSPFMASAAAAVAEASAGVSISPAAFPVWANATAAPYGGDVTATLVAQLTAPVRFAETLAGIGRTGVTRFVHIGPGDVTAGLATRSVQGTEAIVVSSLDDVGAAADRLAPPSVASTWTD